VDACLNVSRAILRLSESCRREPKLLLHLTQCKDLVTSLPPVASADAVCENQQLCKDLLFDLDVRMSALAACALLGHLSCARQLLESKADPNLCSELGSLHPVAAAASGANAEMLVLLISSGAHVNEHDDHVCLVLNRERARRHTLAVIKATQFKAAASRESIFDQGSVLHVPPPTSLFQRQTSHQQQCNASPDSPVEHHPAASMATSACMSQCMGGKRVPMTALIAAVLSYVTGGEQTKRNEYLRVCRVLMEAGADKRIAAKFFRSECFVACLDAQGHRLFFFPLYSVFSSSALQCLHIVNTRKYRLYRIWLRVLMRNLPRMVPLLLSLPLVKSLFVTNVKGTFITNV
jgi:hypothetical protein